MREKKGGHPTFMVIVLPEGGADIYTAVKQYAGRILDGYHLLNLSLTVSGM